MLRNDPKIADLMHNNSSELLSKLRGITLEESRSIIAEMSFVDYMKLLEDGANITPPSGQTVGPASNTTTPTSTPGTTPGAPPKAQVLWTKGIPAQKGMTVGLKGKDGLPVPGEITQVDTGASGVKVRNPTTGQEEWHGNNELQPFMATNKPQAQAPQQGQQIQQPPPVAESEFHSELSRLRELAGIAEDASCGATGAGAIAMAPSSMGKVKRRQPVDEVQAKEYTPGPQKTVVGDTKPNQASGELSATLAANGKKTASRINNGFKR